MMGERKWKRERREKNNRSVFKYLKKRKFCSHFPVLFYFYFLSIIKGMMNISKF